MGVTVVVVAVAAAEVAAAEASAAEITVMKVEAVVAAAAAAVPAVADTEDPEAAAAAAVAAIGALPVVVVAIMAAIRLICTHPPPSPLPPASCHTRRLQRRLRCNRAARRRYAAALSVLYPCPVFNKKIEFLMCFLSLLRLVFRSAPPHKRFEG